MLTGSSPTLDRLEAATRDFHGHIDGHWLELLASGVTKQRYKQHLVRVYGFEAPLESALAYTPQLVLADRLDRIRSGLIAQDLLALGVSPAKVTALPQCEGVSSFADPAEALGWKYVIERPTQHHDSIRRNIQSRLDDSRHATAYLSAYNGCAAARWLLLGRLLDHVSMHRGSQERIVEAARNAFACMSLWYDAIPSEAVAS